MKFRSILLIIVTIVSSFSRFKLYKTIVPNKLYNYINPRQFEGIMNLVFYLCTLIQITLIIVLLIDFKRNNKQDFIIIAFTFLLLLFNLLYIFK